MKSAGKAACTLPHGVLFRGNAEASIRKQLVRSGYLKGIIGLPANRSIKEKRSGFTSLDQSTAKLRWTVLLVMPPI